MPETLHTCPGCNTPNFTARGLKAHRCKGPKPKAAESVEVEVMPESSELVTTEPSTLTSPIARQIATINEHWRASEHHYQQSCAHLIMAGHQLLDLKRQTKHGEWGKLFGGEGKLKHEFQFGFSQQWAARLMEMAKASKNHLPELAALPFNQPLSDWKEDNLETLRSAVSKKADGETFQQLAFEWGVSKKKHIPKNPSTAAKEKGGEEAGEQQEQEEPETPAPEQSRQKAKRLAAEDAREIFNGLIEQWRKAVTRGHLDDLPADEVHGLEEFLRVQLDAVKARRTAA